jgi:hypothetical protein
MTPTKCHERPFIKWQSVRSHAWAWILGVAGVFAILLTFVYSNSTPSPIAQLNFAPAMSMTAEERKQRGAGWTISRKQTGRDGSFFKNKRRNAGHDTKQSPNRIGKLGTPCRCPALELFPLPLKHSAGPFESLGELALQCPG